MKNVFFENNIFFNFCSIFVQKKTTTINKKNYLKKYDINNVFKINAYRCENSNSLPWNAVTNSLKII